MSRTSNVLLEAFLFFQFDKQVQEPQALEKLRLNKLIGEPLLEQANQ